MSPNRVAKSVGHHCVENLKGLRPMSFSFDAGVVVSLIIVSLSSLVLGSIHMTVFSVVLFVMFWDMIVGALKAVISPVENFDITRLFGGFLGKLFRLLIIPVASVVDFMYAISPFPMSDQVEGLFPITIVVMYALAGAEIASTLNHFKEGGVAPGVIAVIMRHLDRLKLGGEPPSRRSYDLAAKAVEEEAENAKILDEIEDHPRDT